MYVDRLASGASTAIVKALVVDLDDTLVPYHKLRLDLKENYSKAELEEGVREFLTLYRGKVSLLTSGDRERQENKIRFLGIGGLFSEILIAEKSFEGKRSMLEDFILRNRLDPRSVVMIGDRPGIDIRAGKSLGCRTVRVRFPHGKYSTVEPECREEQADITVSDFASLSKLVSNWFAAP